MPKANIFDEDDETFQTVIVDGRKVRVLKDGAKLHNGMMMMDGGAEILQNTAQYLRQQALRDKAIADATRRDTTKETAMTKQGFSFSDADARKFGLKDGGIALHRPGFRFNGADPYARDSAILAYHDKDVADAEAWKTPTPLPYSKEVTGAGSHGPDLSGEGVEGDSCMTNGGARGVLRRGDDGALVCVPDGAQDAATVAMSNKERAHAEYIRDLTSAYRMGADREPVRQTDAAPTVKDAKDHAAYMDSLYRRLDDELSNKWRNNGA